MDLAALSSNEASPPAQIKAGPFLGNGSSRSILRNYVLDGNTRNAVEGTIEPRLPHDIGDRSTGYLADACKTDDVVVREEVGDVLVDLQQRQG